MPRIRRDIQASLNKTGVFGVALQGNGRIVSINARNINRKFSAGTTLYTTLAGSGRVIRKEL